MPYTISANRLTDGAVIYIAENNQWTTQIESACLLDTEEQAQALLPQANSQNHVIGAYLIEMNQQKPHTPKLYREQVRTKGPSVRLDLGIQAGQVPPNE